MRAKLPGIATSCGRIGFALAAAIAFSACGSGQEAELLPDYNPAPHQVNRQAAVADTSALRLPLQLSGQQVVAPGWGTPPHVAGDVYLSAEHHDDVLTFRAVDATGLILWEAQRPLSCTGFTLTSANDQHLAVLTDIDAEVQTFGHTVATGYDLHTGEQLWEPVDVPGPHHGPGTVFASPPEAAMGSIGPKVVLDPGTGQVVLDERDTPEIRILGEFHGTILVQNNGQVKLFDAATLATSGLEAEPQWSLPVTDHQWDEQRLTATAPEPNPGLAHNAGAVLIGTDSTDRALIQLTDGQLLAEELSEAGQDPSSRMWVTVGDDLSGYDANGEPIFDEPLDELGLIGIGGAIAYMKNPDGDIEARNVITGALSRSYDPQDTGQPVVPLIIDTNGAAILEGENDYYLAPAH